VLLLLKADSDLSRPDDTIQLRGTSDGNLIAEFDSSQHDFSNPSWHPDAKQSEFIVVEGSRLAMLRLVAGKLKVLQRFARLDKSGEPANSVDFTSPTYSPDGRQVAAVDGGEVIVWDTNTGLVRAEFRAHVDVCTSLAWLGNSRLATGNREDMKVRIWNVSNSELVVTLPGQRFCNQLAFHKPTRTLAMNRQDSEIKLFHVDIRDWEKRAIETVQRNLTEDEWHTYIRTTRACPVMIPKLSGVK
jgi:WD40 repeat protein